MAKKKNVSNDPVLFLICYLGSHIWIQYPCTFSLPMDFSFLGHVLSCSTWSSSKILNECTMYKVYAQKKAGHFVRNDFFPFIFYCTALSILTEWMNVLNLSWKWKRFPSKSINGWMLNTLRIQMGEPILNWHTDTYLFKIPKNKCFHFEKAWIRFPISYSTTIAFQNVHGKWFVFVEWMHWVTWGKIFNLSE